MKFDGLSISEGNIKLGLKGEQIYAWSLPPKISCPGESEKCGLICFGLKSERQYPAVREAWKRNLEISKNGDFVDKFNRLFVKLRRRKKRFSKIFRIHAVGDMYDKQYILAWYKIVKNNPDITFYLYTRSWRFLSFYEQLCKLQELPNVHGFLSMDDTISTPLPENYKELGWRVAYIEGQEKVDAVRCPAVYKKRLKITCGKCRFCFNPASTRNVVFKEH